MDEHNCPVHAELDQHKLEVDRKFFELDQRISTGQFGEHAMEVIANDVQKRLEDRMMQQLGQSAFRVGVHAIVILGLLIIGLGFYIVEKAEKLGIKFPWLH